MNKKRKAAIKNILKFNKTKFNYNKFVRDFYLEKNTAYVSVNIDNYNDVISKYSISNYEWLNPEFADYVEETAYYIPFAEFVCASRIFLFGLRSLYRRQV